MKILNPIRVRKFLKIAIVVAALFFCKNLKLSAQNQTIIDTSNNFIMNKIHYSDSFGIIFWKCDSLVQ
jgi:hypothetical protein